MDVHRRHIGHLLGGRVVKRSLGLILVGWMAKRGVFGAASPSGEELLLLLLAYHFLFFINYIIASFIGLA